MVGHRHDGRRHHLRAAARRDRPLGRLGQRCRRRGRGRAQRHPRRERVARRPPRDRSAVRSSARSTASSSPRIGAPAFAVTLAGLLFWLGFMLQILGDTGTINLDSDGVVGKLTTYYFTDVAAAYGLAAVAVIGYFLAAFLDTRRREAAGVPSRPLGEIVRAHRRARACSPSPPRSCSTSTAACRWPWSSSSCVLVGHGLRPAPHHLRPEDLRARRQRRGVPPRRHQRHRDPDLGLLHRRHLRGDRRPVLGLQDRGSQPGLRRPVTS